MRDNGFSLIELMVVVLIIGVLAVIAIPNFLGQRSKAIQSELKTTMGAILTAEKSYFADRNAYTDNLNLVGLTMEGTPVFLYGFASDVTPAASGVNDTAEYAAVNPGRYQTSKMVTSAGVPLAEADLPAAAIAGPQTIVIGAVGNIDQDALLDKWTVSTDGILMNTVSDLE